MNVTFDANQLIALENNYPQASDIRELIAMNDRKEITLRVCAMSASEKQRGNTFLETFTEFRAWVAALDLDRAELILPLCYSDISYWDCCRVSGWGTNVIEAEIHKILFGSTDIELNHEAHIKRYANESSQKQQEEYFRWRNAICDVQSYWSHMTTGGGLFVTDDSNFHKVTKKPDLISLSGGGILHPDEAVAFIRSGQSLSPASFDVKAFIQTPDHQTDKNTVPKALKHYWKWRESVVPSLPNQGPKTVI